jgi:hypothetical protein
MPFGSIAAAVFGKALAAVWIEHRKSLAAPIDNSGNSEPSDGGGSVIDLRRSAIEEGRERWR